MTEPRKRIVWYLLSKERNDKSQCIPVASYPTYVEALKAGEPLNDGLWHHKIKRHSMPYYPEAA